MHIKPADRDVVSAASSQPSSKLKEPSALRKVRLGGGAARVPSSNQTIDSPLRVLVSAIGQSISSRTPLRKINTSSSSKNEATSSSTRSSRMANTPTATAQTPSKHSSSGRVIITASTPKRSSLSSSTNSSSYTSTPMKKQNSSLSSSHTPGPKKSSGTSSFGSSSRSSNDPTTPVLKRGSFGSVTRSSNDPTTPVPKRGMTMPPKTPTASSRTLNNPSTPISSYSSIPTAAKKQTVLSTPISKQFTSSVTERNNNSSTPITKPTGSLLPTTPVNGYSNARTPLTTVGSNIPFYTPKSSLPSKSTLPSPLQPRDTNIPESSRRLHFGLNLSAMTDQENAGVNTPRAHTSALADATYSFDKNRLAQIKARQNTFQKLLISPAQRIRAPDPVQSAYTPRRQRVGDEFDPSGYHDELSISLNPTRRKVANSLF